MDGGEEKARREALEARADYYRLKSLEVAQRLEDRAQRQAVVRHATETAKAAATGTARAAWWTVKAVFVIAALVAFVALTKDCPR